MVVRRRIKRNFRQCTPGKFRTFYRKVKLSMTNNPHYPAPIWGDSTVLQQFFEIVDRLEVAYHLASNGDRILIMDRDKLINETKEILEEMALLLEAASVKSPDALLTTGFSVTQERRSIPRPKKTPLSAPVDFTVVNSGQTGKAVGSANDMPGAFNHEIQFNRRDPSQEADWLHKGIYPGVSEMIMEYLEAGNTFFRMRHHGPEGPGPWSSVTSVWIS